MIGSATPDALREPTFYFAALAGAFFAAFFGCTSGLLAFFVAASKAVARAILVAVIALRLARVLLDFATVFPLPAAPLRNIDRLVVMCWSYLAQARSIPCGTVMGQ